MHAVALHNYPNPFNPQTTITIDMPKDDKVAVMIYDALGRYIGKVYEEFTHAGKIKVSFDATRLAGGMYYAVAKTTQSLAVCKMSLLK